MGNAVPFTWWERWLLARLPTGVNSQYITNWLLWSYERPHKCIWLRIALRWNLFVLSINLPDVVAHGRYVEMRLGSFGFYWCPNNDWFFEERSQCKPIKRFFFHPRSLHAQYTFDHWYVRIEFSRLLHAMRCKNQNCYHLQDRGKTQRQRWVEYYGLREIKHA